MVSISPLEGALCFVLVVGCLVTGAAVGGFVLIESVGHIIRKLGLTVYLGYADKPATADAVKDEPKPSPEPEPEDNDEPAGVEAGRPHMPIGQCRGCGLHHAGLCPVSVEMTIAGIVVPPGTPFVCPRCWVGLNPQDRTNIARGGFEPNPPTFGRSPIADMARVVEVDDAVEESRRSFHHANPRPTEPKPVKSAPPADDMEAATAPDITCEKCGCRGKDNPQVVFREMRAAGGRLTGKFWCIACVDALAGPGDKKRPKK